jgi:ketosteroid isomerase-like protein
MPVQATKQQQSMAANTSYPDIERIYHDWDKALAKNDAVALLALYAPDGTLESPLVPHLMGTEQASATVTTN